MKKREIFSIILSIILLFPLILSQELNNSNKNTLSDANLDLNKINTNKWNENVIISPEWQGVFDVFFGLNLKEGPTQISVREAIVLFMIFIMFTVILYDLVKFIPFFNKKMFGFIKTEFIAALIISILVSITGAFISLKNLFLNTVKYLTDSLNFSWLELSLNNWWGGIILGIIIILIIFVIHEFLDWMNPFIKKYSEISRAKAKGRALNSVIKENAPE